MTIETAVFPVLRGSEVFQCKGDDLDSKAKDDDYLLVQNPGATSVARVARENFFKQERKFTDPIVDGFTEHELKSQLAQYEYLWHVGVANHQIWVVTVTHVATINDPPLETVYEAYMKVYKTEDLSIPLEHVTSVNEALDDAVDARGNLGRAHNFFFEWIDNQYVMFFDITRNDDSGFGQLVTGWTQMAQWSGKPDDELIVHRYTSLDVTLPSGSGVFGGSVDGMLYVSNSRSVCFFTGGDFFADASWVKVNYGKNIDNNKLEPAHAAYYDGKLFYGCGGNSAFWCFDPVDFSGDDNEVFSYYATESYSKLLNVCSGDGITIAANDSSWTYIYWTDKDPTTKHFWNKVEIGSSFRVRDLKFDPELHLAFCSSAKGEVFTSPDAVNWTLVPNGTGSKDWEEMEVSNPLTGQLVVCDREGFKAYFTGYALVSSGVDDNALVPCTDVDGVTYSTTAKQVKSLLNP